MEYVNLGKTGLKVSRICLGCMSYGEVPAVIRPGSHAWALNEEQSQPFFKQALDLGINFWDTANVYSIGSSERLVGKFLKENTKRENMVIATKLHGVMRDDPNGKGLSRKEIFFELDQSLQRLQTDYVDLFLVHTPFGFEVGIQFLSVFFDFAKKILKSQLNKIQNLKKKKFWKKSKNFFSLSDSKTAVSTRNNAFPNSSPTSTRGES